MVRYAVFFLKFGGALALLLLSLTAFAADTPDKSASGLSDGELRRFGERIYRDGVLPDGSPLRGVVRGDVEIDSTMFSCTNCHSRSGLGSVEGQIASPSINGATLFAPRYIYNDFLRNSISEKRGVQREAKPLRPAYTDESLAEAISGGIDPNGKVFVPVMPRYLMEDKDMKILISYLKNLSTTTSPGITDTSMRLATIVSDDVSPEDRDALLIPLKNLVTLNKQTASLKKTPQYAKMARMLDEAYFRNLEIVVWELKGPASTWRTQLEDYYRKDPVFAILSGMTGSGEWRPIHEFCETMQLPALFPLTDFPVISTSDWYTWYLSKGYSQEGDTAARFIASNDHFDHAKPVVQIVSATREGEALSAGFAAAWQETGKARLETVKLPAGSPITPADIRNAVEKFRPAAVVLWGGTELKDTLLQVSSDRNISVPLFVSARYLKEDFSAIPDVLRETVYITYPYRLPQNESKYDAFKFTLLMSEKPKHKDLKRITSRTFSGIHVFLEGLKELKLNFYRDNLLDVIAMMQDQYLPDFERLSFGPGQRYASKGCYIVQAQKGTQLQLKKVSDWVVF